MTRERTPIRGAAAIALAVALVMFTGFFSLMAMFALGSVFGSINDVCNALAAVLSAALAWIWFPRRRNGSGSLAAAGLVLANVGAMIAVAGTVLVMSGSTGFFLAGMYTMTGYGLIGLWLLVAARISPWPEGLAGLARLAGVVMAVGLAAIPSIFMGIDAFEDAAWHSWLGQLGFLGYSILYPVWCLQFWSQRAEGAAQSDR